MGRAMWRPFVYVVSGLAVFGLAVGSYVGYTQVGDSKDSEAPLPEGVSVISPPPVDPVVPLPPLLDVSAAAPVRDGVSCPAGWLFFDNPVVHYYLCYPPGWGVPDATGFQRLITIPGEQLYGLTFWAQELFAEAPAATPPDARFANASDATFVPTVDLKVTAPRSG